MDITEDLSTDEIKTPQSEESGLSVQEKAAQLKTYELKRKLTEKEYCHGICVLGGCVDSETKICTLMIAAIQKGLVEVS
jgi:hypothetical protein